MPFLLPRVSSTLVTTSPLGSHLLCPNKELIKDEVWCIIEEQGGSCAQERAKSSTQQYKEHTPQLIQEENKQVEREIVEERHCLTNTKNFIEVANWVLEMCHT